jgi:hypothetical protein
MPYVEAVRDRRVDYVYVSHGHHDHFHPPTLKLFRGSKILVAAGSELARGIRDLGFEVIECGSQGETELGSGVRCRIMETYADDTLMAVSANEKTCLNVNDSLHAAPGGHPAEVLSAHPAALRSARLRILRLRYRLPLPQLLCPAGKGPRGDRGHAPGVLQSRVGQEPRFGFPFAADVAFLDDELFLCNEPVHNAERPTEAYAKLAGTTGPTRVMDIAPGSRWTTARSSGTKCEDA